MCSTHRYDVCLDPCMVSAVTAVRLGEKKKGSKHLLRWSNGMFAKASPQQEGSSHGPGSHNAGAGLKLISRPQIDLLDQVHGTGRSSRVLSRWSQFGALVFAQLAGRQGLRDVVSSLASQAKALAPLRLMPPKRSTLVEANERRPSAWSQALFFTLSGSKARSSPWTAPPSPWA
jgi:hypothetical protein